MLPSETCDEGLLSKIVESRPDLIPSAEGKLDLPKLISTVVKPCYLQSLSEGERESETSEVYSVFICSTL